LNDFGIGLEGLIGTKSKKHFLREPLAGNLAIFFADLDADVVALERVGRNRSIAPFPQSGSGFSVGITNPGRSPATSG